MWGFIGGGGVGSGRRLGAGSAVGRAGRLSAGVGSGGDGRGCVLGCSPWALGCLGAVFWAFGGFFSVAMPHRSSAAEKSLYRVISGVLGAVRWGMVGRSVGGCRATDPLETISAVPLPPTPIEAGHGGEGEGDPGRACEPWGDDRAGRATPRAPCPWPAEAPKVGVGRGGKTGGAAGV